MKRTFYRVANNHTKQGLWYDFKGSFTGLIHGEFNFCKNNKLLMPFDPNIVGWLSATETLKIYLIGFQKMILKGSNSTGIQLVSMKPLNIGFIITTG